MSHGTGPVAALFAAQCVVGDDGRTHPALMHGRPAPIGRYELRFKIGPYYAAQGIRLSDPTFLDVIPIQFGIAEPEGHLHVPLLVTPWSYTTYRGS